MLTYAPNRTTTQLAIHYIQQSFYSNINVGEINDLSSSSQINSSVTLVSSPKYLDLELPKIGQWYKNAQSFDIGTTCSLFIILNYFRRWASVHERLTFFLVHSLSTLITIIKFKNTHDFALTSVAPNYFYNSICCAINQQ